MCSGYWRAKAQNRFIQALVSKFPDLVMIIKYCFHRERFLEQDINLPGMAVAL
jgi:hypothetical protein